jgi:hypothetical protein
MLKDDDVLLIDAASESGLARSARFSAAEAVSPAVSPWLRRAISSPNLIAILWCDSKSSATAACNWARLELVLAFAAELLNARSSESLALLFTVG